MLTKYNLRESFSIVKWKHQRIIWAKPKKQTTKILLIIQLNYASVVFGFCWEFLNNFQEDWIKRHLKFKRFSWTGWKLIGKYHESDINEKVVSSFYPYFQD